jgi:hypothetical protein
MFTIIAKANGNKVNEKTQPKKELPKADFNTLAAFIGAM